MTDHVCSCGGNCGCAEEHTAERKMYLTRDEYISRLEQYLVDLKAEIRSVETELAELHGVPVLEG